LLKSGQDVVIVKNGRRLCGTGGAISNVPIIQNKAYFEVKVQAKGYKNKLNIFEFEISSIISIMKVVGVLD
jgi:hypothetical protein